MSYPTWFKAEAGFCFVDPDGDLCIFLGKGGWRLFEPKMAELMVGNEKQASFMMHMVKTMPDRDVYAFRYKNEWHLNDIETALMNNGMDFLNKCKPLVEQPDDPIKKLIEELNAKKMKWPVLVEFIQKECDLSVEPFNQRIYLMEKLARDLAHQAEIDLGNAKLESLIEHYGENAGRAIHALNHDY